jgi:hypothetical protein
MAPQANDFPENYPKIKGPTPLHPILELAKLLFAAVAAGLTLILLGRILKR